MSHRATGVVDNVVKLSKGMIRVHVLALERKLGVTSPIGHVALPWVVEAVFRGQDNRTAFERLYGKPAREEALELGEIVLWRRPG